MNYSAPPCSLRQLQYIVAVADELNFRRAAERCFVSQPSLSSQVAAAELALGVVLFERDRRRVLITDAGREIVARAREIVTLASDLSDAAETFHDPFCGTLRVGIIPTVGPYLLPTLDPALRSAFPNLEVRWIEEKTETLVDKIEAAQLDAAVLALEADIAPLTHEPLFEDPFVLAMSRTHPIANDRESFKIADLKRRDVLLLDDGHCFRDQTLELCASVGATEQGFRATSLATLVQMVASSEFLTLLPAMAVDVENRHERLLVKPFASPPPFRTIVVAWRKSSAKSDALKTVSEVGRRACQALAG